MERNKIPAFSAFAALALTACMGPTPAEEPAAEGAAEPEPEVEVVKARADGTARIDLRDELAFFVPGTLDFTEITLIEPDGQAYWFPAWLDLQRDGLGVDLRGGAGLLLAPLGREEMAPRPPWSDRGERYPKVCASPELHELIDIPFFGTPIEVCQLDAEWSWGDANGCDNNGVEGEQANGCWQDDIPLIYDELSQDLEEPGLTDPNDPPGGPSQDDGVTDPADDDSSGGSSGDGSSGGSGSSGDSSGSSGGSSGGEDRGGGVGGSGGDWTW